MGILNLDDVPPPFGAEGRDRPAGGTRTTPAPAAAAETKVAAPAGEPSLFDTSALTEPGEPVGAPAGGESSSFDTGAPPPLAGGGSSPFDTGAPPPPAGGGSSPFDTSALTAPAEPPGAAASEPPAEIEADPVRTLELKPLIVEQLATVFDPEIPVNIYDLGLIYDVAVDKQGLAVVRMTLTAPGCPAAVTLPAEVQGKVKGIEGVTDARVDLVWEPPWDKDRMSDAAKLQLGIFD